jgi:hypothetical protein
MENLTGVRRRDAPLRRPNLRTSFICRNIFCRSGRHCERNRNGVSISQSTFLKVQAPDDKGETQIWAVEWAGGAQLAQANVAKDTLKPGDQVVVSGNPGRNASEHRIRLKSITRTDGFKWEGVIQ